ncbi:MAG: glycoside hydrolase family 2 TIM barrel-domain containing protein [Rariglobus sp.]
MFFRLLFSAVLISFLGCETSSFAASPGRGEVLLPVEKWRVQAASEPTVAPVEKSWVASLSRVDGAADSVWYEQTITCPADWNDGRRVFLDFERIEGDSILFINGTRVAEMLAPGGEVELTSIPAGRDLQVRVFVTRAYTGISRTFEQDLLRYAVRKSRDTIPMKEWKRGITAPARLVSRPAKAAVTDVFVITSWREKSITLEVEVDAKSGAGGVVLEAVVTDAEKRTVLSFKTAALSVPAGRSVQRLSSPWRDPITWELDKPHLYQVNVRLTQAGGAVDTAPATTFGFREVWADGRTLILNGHPIRLRMTDLYGASANALSFYRLMGYNSGQIQPHAKLWWDTWNDTPLLDEAMIAEADRLGFALTAPAPTLNGPGTGLIHNAPLREAYEREMRRFIRKYRNHPSLLAWAVGMNSYNPTSNIHAPTLGRRESSPTERGRTIEKAVEIARSADPTRLSFSHADGGFGDISTANVYLNFAPLQEREEWPMAWAKSGDMPYSAVEFGQPFTANFWKGNQFLMTEYLAMYLGDRAYERETEGGLAALVDIGLANKRGFGDWKKVDTSLFPGYWEYQDLFVERTNRAWRTWGVNAGWVHWNLDVGYGNRSASPVDTSFLSRYKNMPAPVTERPSWANKNFDIHSKANHAFLAYIAGGGVHTDRTHAFYAGERFEKQIAIVWDGADTKTVTVSWTLAAGETKTANDSRQVTIAPGQILFVPLTLTAPKQDAVLSMRVTEGDKEIAADTFAIQVFEKPTPVVLSSRVVLWDPAGKSGDWLRRLGVKPVEFRAGEKFNANDVLVIGREALKPGETIPYTAKDIELGLRVLVLEQQPAVWEMLGFETLETMPRYVFAADAQSPVLAGLKAVDLLNWRGSPDLLPEGQHVRTYDNLRAPHWTNRHAVASVVLKTPEVVGFTPLLKTEFDLAYTPLLEWRQGKGVVYFSSLDFSGRVGIDPAATRLADNLMRSLERPLPATVPVHYRGDAAGEALLGRLQIAAQKTAPANGTSALWVLGGDQPESADVAAFIQSGGTVLRLPQSAKALRAAGVAAEDRSIARVVAPAEPVSVLRGVGPELLRWREALAATVFSEGEGVVAGGILRGKVSGRGREIWLQVSPDLLADKHADAPAKREAVQLSVSRLHRLTAQVLTNLGATPSPSLSNRVATLGRVASFQPISGWNVLGPWKSGLRNGKALMDEVWPGETDAIAGDDNPNTTYRRADGTMLDWRRVVNANETGYVNFQKEFMSGEGSVVYAQRKIRSEKNRIVRMRLGADYWLRFWVNGKLQLDVSEAHASPQPAAFQIDVPLRAGENVLTIKAGAGSKGFGFWADMGEPAGGGAAASGPADMGPPVNFYTRLFKPFDPYQFHYW